MWLSRSSFFFFSSRRRHTRFDCDWSSDVCSSDLEDIPFLGDTAQPEPEAAADSALADDGYYVARESLLAKFDRRFLTKVVIAAGGNLFKAARMAPLDRPTFYRLMERYPCHRDTMARAADDCARR